MPPIAAKYLPKYNQPLDFGKFYRGKRIFGDHKTIRGIIVGIIFSELLFLLQAYLFNNNLFIRNNSLVNYNQISIFFGFALGLGALGGDAIKSFLKRQVGIKPGTSWFPWDQIDWIIGTLLISNFFIPISAQMSFTFLVIGLLLHLIVKIIGYLIKMNNTLI